LQNVFRRLHCGVGAILLATALGCASQVHGSQLHEDIRQRIGVVQPTSELPFKRDQDAAPSIGAGAALMLVFVLGLGAWMALSQWRRRMTGSSVRRVTGNVRIWKHWITSAQQDSVITVVSSKRLTSRASIHVIRWQQRELLVACNDQGASLLAQTVWPAATGLEPEIVASAEAPLGERV
jgi:flagellar protein FliO/FliZ